MNAMKADPPARVISNELFSYSLKDSLNTRPLNAFVSSFGQFSCHEILWTHEPFVAKEQEVYMMPVPLNDPYFDPFGEGDKSIPIVRAAKLGTSDKKKPRTLINHKTPVIDASAIYGIDTERLEAIRNQTHREYLAVYHVGNGEALPMLNSRGFFTANNPARKDLHLFGDERPNIQPILFSIQVLFMREHNRLVDEMRKQPGFGHLSADGLFFEARRRVIAYQQNIILNEHIPAITGFPLPEYKGYNDEVNPQIDDYFVSSASRYGHSEFGSSILRVEDHDIAGVPLDLRDVVFHPEVYVDEGIDNIVRGTLISKQEKVRSQYVDDLRNFLFGLPGRGGIDLVATEIQRSRDFGVPLYNHARQMHGLEPVSSFNQVINDTNVVKILNSLYDHDPNKADSFVVGFAEDKVPGTNFGPLFLKSIRSQMERVRDGDRFFFESPDAGFSEKEIADIKTQTITSLILRNSGIYELPCSGFYVSQFRDCTKPRPAANATGALGNSTSSAAFLGGKVVINWQIDPIKTDEIIITITSLSTGWVALGLPRNPGNMLDTDAMIVSGSGSSVKVEDFNIFGQRRVGCPGVCLDSQQGGSNDIISFSGSDDGVKTQATFRRKLNTGDKLDVVIVNDGEPTPVLVAFGNSDTLGYHGGNKQSGQINFFTGSSQLTSEPSGPKDRLTIHGVLMVFAWLFVFPLGIFLVKFCKRLLLRWWFRLHMIIQYIGTLFVICALILAVEAVAAEGEKHITNAHAILGIITVALAIIVPALGQLTSLVWTPTRKFAIFPDWLHYILGYAAPMFSCVTIFFGIHEKTHNDSSSWWWYFLVALWIAIVIAAFFFFWMFQALFNYLERKNKGDATQEVAEDKEKEDEEHWSSAEDSD